jgi:hypothetical protein
MDRPQPPTRAELEAQIRERSKSVAGLLAQASEVSGGVLAGRSAVAKHFGVAVRTVAYWTEQGMPRLGSNLFDAEAIDKWLTETGIRRETSSGDRAEILRLDAEIKRLKLAKLRDELVDVAGVESLFRRHIQEAKAILDQLPARIAATVVKKHKPAARASAAACVRDACQSLADLLTKPEED